ncbi:hypothetical protein GEV27_03640 [Aeromicrobium sp. S22]|uniref:CHAP domain-containing protein n=1 Tax=Aeromicrobium sp. S22 TaxID=2662029 RepID=UPI00129EEE78|nr:CHAP domain-containing protein [Aeromicrobium sp. S22]MRK00606.1 hypothetical protein [Aeromicrobium sp. S22]
MPVHSAQAAYTVLCTGYSSCTTKGYPHGGYESHKGTSYWNMYTGTNCTNYVAYRLVTTNKMPNKRPKSGVGNARDWGTTMSSITDSKPVVGSVAWWGKTGNHVAYVEKVVSSTEIYVSESNWSGSFDWRRITKSGSGWPDGFIHFADPVTTAPPIVNESKPAILSEPQVGETLKASGGVWSPKGNTYAYQWLADGKAISGATAKTFTPSYSQLAKDLTVSVTATRPGYTTAKAVSPARDVVPGTFTSNSAPVVTGVPRVDSELVASTGGWSPAASAYTYQWLADDTAIAGATSSTFVPGPAQAGRAITVRVRAAKGGYTAATSTSAPTVAVGPGSLASTSRPSVSGTPQVGSRLTASPGAWSRPSLTYAYQWLVDGAEVAGATASSFAPRASDIGRTVSVRVTAGRAGYTSASAVGAATTAVVRGVLTVRTRPSVSGTPRVGATLTAAPGSWSSPATASFRWYAGDQAVAGATGRTFTPTHRERGQKIRVRVTGTQDGFTSVASSSPSAGVVATGRITVSAAPRIAGTARLGTVLTVQPGSHAPANASARYQWLRDGKVLSGATGRSRRVTTNDLGHRLSAKVTFKATGYAATTVTTGRSAKAKATSTLKATPATTKRGQVTFSVRVTATGVSAPGGTVTVHYGSSRTRTVKVTKGKATITLTGQAAGTQPYRFTYSGVSTVAGSTYTRSVTIS